MKAETFVKHFKKYYPNAFESLTEEFEKRARQDAQRKRRLNEYQESEENKD